MAKDRILKVLNQAKETLARASERGSQTWSRLSSPAERARQAQDRVLAHLKSIGVATRSEVQALERRISQLEAALGNGKTAAPKPATAKKPASPKKSETFTAAQGE